MSRERFQRIKELFARACDLSPDEQGAFLDEACGGDAELRAEVAALLDADRTRAWDIDTPVAEQHPETIGAYRIVSVIGRGGMGTVYLAEQESPRRRVAVKVMSFPTPEFLKRFEYEAEILGRLTHPGIAKIIEAGLSDGRPFFAMELIEGVPLTQHAEEAGLDLRARLDLLARVCDAVQHAHQRGVIHRDLKPANIMVEKDGRPRLLDFGVAKLAGPELATLETRAGQLLGTLPYMSPEQLAGDPAAVDVRADVYALGVVGYELLAGRTPRDFSGKSLQEALALAQTAETARLGTLNTTCRGDIETIIGKALERDKERRYDSAGELAADLRRFLNAEPIVARPPSALYQLRKLAQRHRALFAGATVALLAIVIGGVASLLLYLRAEERRVEAEEARGLAEARAETRDEVVGFLVGLFDVVDPKEHRGRTVTAKEILDEGARKIRGSLAAQPEVRSMLMLTLGQIYASLGLDEQARILLDDALKIRTELHGESGEIVGVLLARADVARMQADYDLALTLVRRALAIGTRRSSCLFSLGHIQSTMKDSKAALETFRRARELEDSDRVRHGLSQVLFDLGQFAEAEDLARAALDAGIAAHGETHPAVVARRNVLAGVLLERGRVDDGIEQLEKALAAQEKLTGEESVDAAEMMANLAAQLIQKGDTTRAEALLKRALKIHARWRGANHPRTIMIVSNLGACAAAQRRLDEAIAHYRTALRDQRAISGDRHPVVITYLGALAGLLGEQRKYDEAAALLEEALAIARRIHGEKHPDLIWLNGHLASLRREQGRLDEAERLLTSVHELTVEVYGAETIKGAMSLYQLGKLYRQQGRLKKARVTLAAALALFDELVDPDEESRVGCLGTLGAVYIELGEYRKAGEAMLETARIQERKHGPDHDTVKATYSNLAHMYNTQGEYLLAEKIYARILKHPPKDPQGRVAMRNNHALCLLMLGEGERAEKLFRETLAMLEAFVPPTHAYIGIFHHNIGECLRIQGKTDKAIERFEKALAIYRKNFGGKDNLYVAKTLAKLGQARNDREVGEKALAMCRRLFGDDHAEVAKCLYLLGDESSLLQAVAIFRTKLPGSPLTARAEAKLAARLAARGERAAAQRLLAAALPVLEAKLGPTHPETQTTRQLLKR